MVLTDADNNDDDDDNEVGMKFSFFFKETLTGEIIIFYSKINSLFFR